MPRSHSSSIPAYGSPPEAAWLGRWFTGARRQGFLALLSPEAWHTLSAVLSFTSRDGRRTFTLDQLALALGVPRAGAEARLQQLAEIHWQDAPLATIERDAGGEIAGATLAPVETLARIQPRDDRTVAGSEVGESGNSRPVAGPQLIADLQVTGLNPSQIDWLAQRFDVDRIQRQLDWLPARHAHNPAAMLIRAVEQDWGPPGGGGMTAPDYAHGYLRIPLAVWRAVYCRGALTRRQLQLVSVVIRESWGWQSARGEPYDWTRPLTHRQLADAAGLSTDHIARDLRALLASGVLRQRGERYQFAADPSLWITHLSAATKPRYAATKAQRDAAQTALAAPDVKKAKKGNRNVAAAVDNSAVAEGTSAASPADRFVAVIESFAGVLVPPEVACLRQWIARDGVAAAWRALEPWLRQGKAQARRRVRALLAERNRSSSPDQAAFALEDERG